MLHTDPQFAESVEAVVTEVELHTDAEVVVVAAERSGSYRDVSYAAASVVALASLVALLAVPWTHQPVTAVVEVALTWGIAAWLLSGRLPLRLLVPRRRREAQVAAAVEREFTREQVHATPNRTGVLVYVSALERRVELYPDLGVRGRIPDGAWAKVRGEFSHDDLDHFLRGMREVGDLLARHIPKLENDLVDLPNAPRVRP